ncbi:MAG: alpha/beta fold hydrolase [Pseudomonadales bacterium]|nr:alpha/beta fold hydrolase [Pseudomonadales bacterium]
MHMRQFILTLLLATQSGVAGAEAAQGEPRNEPITIWSDGTRLAGNLWKPEGLAADEKRPAILLVHGWGGLRSHLNQAYAPQFAQLGYVVLTFDYRGWGDSDGKLVRTGARPQGDLTEYVLRVQEIREIVDPLDQLEDIRAAYYYLLGDQNVDTGRLAIWGSSLGGGLALATAASLPGFKVLITQIGSVNPQAGLDSRNPQSPLSADSLNRWRTARSRGEVPPFPGSDSAMEGLRGSPDWPEFVRYDPFPSRESLTAATLIIDAANEELFDIKRNGEALYLSIKDRVTTRYETLPGTHYDIYRGEGYQAALAMEMDWLREHLPVSPRRNIPQSR